MEPSNKIIGGDFGQPKAGPNGGVHEWTPQIQDRAQNIFLDPAALHPGYTCLDLRGKVTIIAVIPAKAGIQGVNNKAARWAAFHFFFLTPLGQQTGQGSAPRYLWPRLHFFQPPRFAFGIINSFQSCRLH